MSTQLKFAIIYILSLQCHYKLIQFDLIFCFVLFCYFHLYYIIILILCHSFYTLHNSFFFLHFCSFIQIGVCFQFVFTSCYFCLHLFDFYKKIRFTLQFYCVHIRLVFFFFYLIHQYYCFLHYFCSFFSLNQMFV